MSCFLPRGRLPTFLVGTCLAALATAPAARAQEFRVYTAVSEMNPRAASRVIARSLTLFHAGSVYDHMEELGELVIFEPIHDRFVIIRDYTAATIPLAELRRMLEEAEGEAGVYLADLKTKPGVEAQRAARQIAFQLRPDFVPEFDSPARRLTLPGAELKYDVRTDAAPSATVLQQYLTYADWTARLNAVLHAQAMFPEPRIALNDALRQRGQLPVSVTLTSHDPRERQLRADHEYRWKLQTIDKDLIDQWERLRASDRIQWVSFQEYQRRLVTAARR